MLSRGLVSMLAETREATPGPPAERCEDVLGPPADSCFGESTVSGSGGTLGVSNRGLRSTAEGNFGMVGMPYSTGDWLCCFGWKNSSEGVPFREMRWLALVDFRSAGTGGRGFTCGWTGRLDLKVVMSLARC